MAENSTIPITSDEQSFLDISMNSGFFGLIEMGVMVILMLVIAITKIVSQCKKSKSTEEKLKILQETFDLKAIEKLGVVMKQDGTTVPTETLATLVHTAAQSVANSIQDVTKPVSQTVPATVTTSQVLTASQAVVPTQSQGLTASQAAPVVQSIVIDKSVIEEAVQKSVQNLIASQKQTVVQLDASGKGATEVVVQTDKGAIPVKLNVSKEKTEEVAIEMPANE